MDTQSLVKNGKKFKSTQLFIVAGTVLMTMVISIVCIGLTVQYEVTTDTVDEQSVAYWKEYMPPEQEVWFNKGAEELRVATRRNKLETQVKNVLIFMVNGISLEMLARARFREGENSTNFAWDKFPYVGSLRTQCATAMPCDLSTLATSLFGGVRTTPGLLGLDKRVAFENCLQAGNEAYQVKSIFQQAQQAQLHTGFITSQRITGPLLSPLYAHSANTKWECDADNSHSDCIDVATQLMLGHTGQAVNVIMGGGKQTLISDPNASDSDPLACRSKDKRNLLQDWKYLKLQSNVKFDVLETSTDLEKFNGTNVDYVLGVFANGNLKPEREPNFKTLVRKSLDVLRRNASGYVAVVEMANESQEVAGFQKSLMALDDVMQDTLDDQRFSAQSTLVLVAFMNLLQSSTATKVPEDIRIYATGPNAHLFQSVHDETYLAHAISYSLKIGAFNVAQTTKG